MKIVGDCGGYLDCVSVADVSVGADDDRSGSCSFGDAGDYEIVGADQDGSFDFTEPDAGTAEFGGTETLADDANLAAGQGQSGGDGLDVRLAVDGFFSQQAVRDTHEFLFSGSYRYFIRSPKCSRRCMIASA